MSTTVLEISSVQAKRLEALVKRAHMPVLEIVDLMLEITSAGVDCCASLGGTVTVESVIRALQHIDPVSIPDPKSVELPRNIGEQIQRHATEHAMARRTPEWLAAESIRATARAKSVGFNFMSGHPKVDGVAYQKKMRDAW